MKNVDVLIVGAGIAGITAAIYLKRSNADFVLLEANMPGGKLASISAVENFPGRATMKGPDFALDLINQLDELGITIDYASVQSVTREENGRFRVFTDADNYLARAVIVATGTILQTAGVPGERLLQGRGVSYCATCDGAFFEGRDVAVYGNGDAAVEETLYLLGLARKVYLIVSKKDIEAEEELLDRLLRHDNLEVLRETALKEIKGTASVEKIVVEHEGRLRDIEVAGVFPLVGFKTANQFLRGLGLANRNGYIIVDKDMMSSLPGLFAIGDVVDKRVRQLVTAAGDGAVAASTVRKYLRSIA